MDTKLPQQYFHTKMLWILTSSGSDDAIKQNPKVGKTLNYHPMIDGNYKQQGNLCYFSKMFVHTYIIDISTLIGSSKLEDEFDPDLIMLFKV